MSDRGFQMAAIDHVQLAMPAGGESEAEAFYCGVLGFEVLPKPEPLASRGGRWFACGPTQVHLGVEADFRPAAKAHPALRVDGFDALLAHLERLGVAYRPDTGLPGVRRVYVSDCFGNRIELVDSGRAGWVRDATGGGGLAPGPVNLRVSPTDETALPGSRRQTGSRWTRPGCPGDRPGPA